MWNEKAARQVQQTPKRVLDDIDREAERQGNATRYFKVNDLEPAVVGRRLAKNAAKEARGGAIVGCKRVANFTTDHKAAAAKYMSK